MAILAAHGDSSMEALVRCQGQAAEGHWISPCIEILEDGRVSGERDLVSRAMDALNVANPRTDQVPAGRLRDGSGDGRVGGLSGGAEAVNRGELLRR
jgi:hypothetical protein